MKQDPFLLEQKREDHMQMLSLAPPITVLSRATVDALEAQLETMPLALAEAVAEADPVRAAGLVLAARRTDRSFRLEPETALWLLQRHEDPVLLPCLVGAVEDPIPLLLRFLHDAPPADARASALVACALLLQDRPLPDGFVGLVRRCAVGLHGLQLGALGQALEKLSAPSLQELAQELRSHSPIRSYTGSLETFQRALSGDFQQSLRESLDEGQPYRRAAPKLGRNDPCSCGSGRKYKKCCEGKPVASEYRRWQAPARLLPALLPLHHLVQLQPRALDTHVLELLVEDLACRGPLELANQALDELLQRPDLDQADGVLEIFLLGASQRTGVEDMLRLVARISDQARQQLAQQKRLLLFLLQPGCDELDAALAETLDNPEVLGELAYLLRRHRPAMSVLLGRLALVQGDGGLDSDTLLNGIELARASLGLEEEDPIEEIWFRLEEEDEDDEDDDGPEPPPDAVLLNLQKELTEARQRLRQLESARPPQTRKGTSPSSAPQEAPAPASSAAQPQPTLDPEVKRLRERLQEVKALLRERNEERTRLRQELKASAAVVPAESSSVVVPGAEEAHGESEWADARLPPLMPHWTKTATEELRHVPTLTARLALRLAGELAAGLPSAWQKTKPIQQVEGLHSIRLGISHRMLFSPDLEAGSLSIHRIVSRSDHDLAVKQLAR